MNVKICIYILNIFFAFYRKLSDKQKALLLSFAETESNVEGTINGITQTSEGIYLV